MRERRKEDRIKELNEITISIFSGGISVPDEKIFHSCSENISASGAQICINTLLSVDTVLAIDFTFKALKKKVSVTAKVKWSRAVIEKKLYEAGVQFAGASDEALKEISNYVSWRQKFSTLHSPLWTFTKDTSG